MKRDAQRKRQHISKPDIGCKKYFLSGRVVTFAYLLLGVIFLKTYSFVYDKKVFLGGDNAVYYITGLSIAKGQGYSNLYLPGSPPANHFPVGYPAIVSVIVSVFGETMQAVKTANGFFLFGSIVLLFFIALTLTNNRHLAFVTSFLVMLNPHILFYSYIEMSEMPFIFFVLLSVLMFIKTFRTGSSIRQSSFWFLLISIVITFYIRSMGIVGLGAAVFILSVNRRWMQAAVLITGFVIAYVPWGIRTHNLGGNTHAQQIKMVNPYRPELGTMTITDYPKRIIENLDRYLSKEMPAAINGAFLEKEDYDAKAKWSDYMFGIILLLLTITGIFSLKEFRWYFLILMSGTFMMLLIWPPVWEGVRFMLPSVPFLIFFSITGILFLVKKIMSSISSAPNTYLNYVPFVFTLFFLRDKPTIDALHWFAVRPYPENFKGYFEMAKWSNENLPDSSIICTRKPELFYLFAKRKCINYPLTTDGIEMFNFFKERKITHLTKDNLGYSSSGLYLAPAVNVNIERFLEVKHIDDESGLYEIFYSDSIGYFGERKDGKRTGKAIAKYADGSVYEGEYFNDLKEGYGKLVYKGRTYIGEWKQDKFDGTGTFYFTDKDYYLGGWKSGVRHGEGRIYDKDGNYVTGRWVNGSVNGSTYIYNKNGKAILKGEWKDQRFVPDKN